MVQQTCRFLRLDPPKFFFDTFVFRLCVSCIFRSKFPQDADCCQVTAIKSSQIFSFHFRDNIIIMKSTFAGILLALLIGAAVAFIRPAQPFQVEISVPSGISFKIIDELDNADVAADEKIHPARKCKLLTWSVSASSVQ